jgi:putative tricarboxylic transport membrane protein
MQKNDFISGFVLLIFGIIIFISSMNYPFGKLQSPGAGFIPLIASLILISMSGIIIVTYLIKKKAEVPKQRFFSTKDGPKRIILALSAFFGYRYFFPIIGFVPTNFLFFLFVTRFLGYFSWKKSFIFSFLTTIFAYILFRILLKIPMPTSILGI